jgi:hypothetical protein
MLLALGHPEDLLIREVRLRLTQAGVPVLTIDETQLFSETSFAFHQSGAASTGSLHLGNAVLPFAEISGVLLRLPRLWWPSADYDLQDQMFVYHECSAAWFALLHSLACPIVNRFHLDWWLNDITYPDSLTHDLARSLNLHTHTEPPAETLPARIIPRPPGPDCSSVYLAGSAVIPRPEDDAREISQLLTSSQPALARWQRDSGAQLARLDFVRNSGQLCLRHVEIFPLLDQEPASVVQSLAGATLEMLQ